MIFLNKLFSDVLRMLFYGLSPAQFSFGQCLGFAFSFEASCEDNIIIDYYRKSNKADDENFCLLVNGKKKRYSPVFDYDRFKHNAINNFLDAVVGCVYMFVIYLICFLIFGKSERRFVFLLASQVCVFPLLAVCVWFFARKAQINFWYGKRDK